MPWLEDAPQQSAQGGRRRRGARTRQLCVIDAHAQEDFCHNSPAPRNYFQTRSILTFPKATLLRSPSSPLEITPQSLLDFSGMPDSNPHEGGGSAARRPLPKQLDREAPAFARLPSPLPAQSASAGAKGKAEVGAASQGGALFRLCFLALANRESRDEPSERGGRPRRRARAPPGTLATGSRRPPPPPPSAPNDRRLLAARSPGGLEPPQQRPGSLSAPTPLTSLPL